MNAQPQGLGGATRAVGIAEACCDRWADGTGRLALLHRRADGASERVTYDALRSTSARVAEVLRGYGVKRGDRVATLFSQGPEAVIALIAVLRAGGIAVPLGHALRHAALAYRLRDSGAVALLTDDTGLAAMEGIRPGLPDLRFILSTGQPSPIALPLWEEAQQATDAAPPALVSAEHPALILYGTAATGHARGVVHAHRAPAAQLPGFALLHGGLPQADDLLWTDMDWAAGGTWLDTVLPALALGVPLLAHAMPGFDPARAMALAAREGVRNLVLSPASLRMLREAGREALPPDLRLRSLATAGGALGQDVIDWAGSTLGVPVRDCLARPECGLVLCTSTPGTAARAWQLGHAAPGRDVAVIDARGLEVTPGTIGEIAVLRSDPGLFLGYWNDPAATRATRRGEWHLTGIPGIADEDGCISAAPPPAADAGRTAAETFLLAHPAVAQAAIVGAASGPDCTAIVVPRAGAVPGPDLAAELRGFLRARLSSRACPRRVAFALDLPPPHAARVPAALGAAIGLGGAPAEG